MILEDMIRKCILDALKKVKDADPACQDWVLNESTIVLGEGSAMDSIAFTFFVTECEETIETETHHRLPLILKTFTTIRMWEQSSCPWTRWQRQLRESLPQKRQQANRIKRSDHGN